MGVEIRSASGEPLKSGATAGKRPRRGPAGRAFDLRVRQIASEIIVRQENGAISARQLEASFARDQQLNWKGRPWGHRTLFRVLKRGQELGLPFIVRSRSEAAAQRPPDYRTLKEKRAVRTARYAQFLAEHRRLVDEFDAVSISGNDDESRNGSVTR